MATSALTKVANLTYNGKSVYVQTTAKLTWTTGPNGETILSTMATTATPTPSPTPAPQPNLVLDSTRFNTANWSSYGGPTIGGTMVANPSGAIDAQQVTFPTSRADYFQTLTPTPTAGTYMASIYSSVASAKGQSFYLAYWDGANPMAQFSPAFSPTTAYQRFGWSFTIAAGDTAPSIVIVNVNDDNGTQASSETMTLWGLKVEPGKTMTDYNGSAKPSTTTSPGTTTGTGTGTTTTTGKLLGDWLFAYSAPTIGQIMSTSPKCNYIDYFAATGTGSGGTINLGQVNAPSVADITAWKNSGRTITMCIGGQASDTGQPNACYLNVQSDQDQMFNSIVGLVGTYGFQGVTMDMENDSGQYSPSVMSGLFGRLKAKFGNSFLCGICPAPYQIRGGGVFNSVYNAAPNNVDLVLVQFYGQSNTDNWFINSYIVPGVDAIVSSGIPASKIIIGAALNNGDGGPTGGTAVYQAAWKQSLAKYPTLRGVILWNSTSGESGGAANLLSGMASTMGL